MSADYPDWLAEVLHVVAGFAAREHLGSLPVLVPGHARAALCAVPRSVLDVAGVAHLVDRLD